MLIVKTVIKPSNIHGLGLFADQPINFQDTVWEYHVGLDQLMPESNLVGLQRITREFFETYACFDNGLCLLDGDSSRFMNHSESPNVLCGSLLGRMYAGVDIKAGEELTCDYRKFDYYARAGIL